MPSETFKLRVLTPMFMGGADSCGEPELRAASIRGAMRFWFRAIAGAVTSDPKEVYRLESEVFGNTEQRSKVVVRVRKDTEKYYELNPRQRISSGLAYLANMGLARPGRGFVRKAIAPDSEFWVDVFETGSATGIGTSVLKIAVYLGGLGARWRHGFGSCEIIDEQSGVPIAVDLNKTVKKLRELITELAKSLGIKVSEGIKTLPEFPIFEHPYVEIWEGQLPLESNSWDSIMSYIGQKYREFRTYDNKRGRNSKNTKDFREIIKPIFKGKPYQSDPENDIFGLPIQFRDKITSKVAILNVENQEKNINRRASPLILHIEPYRKLIRATIFKSKFVPDDKDTLYFVEYRSKKFPLRKPTESDYARIVNFVEKRKFLALTRRYPDV